MLELYLPILIFIAIGVAIGVVSLGASFGIGQILGTHRPDSENPRPTSAASMRSTTRA